MFTLESRSGSTLKVWGVPNISTQDIHDVGKDMASAIKNSFRTIKIPVFVVFPEDHSRSRDPFILLEYNETVGYLERTDQELECLAAQLGYIAKQHFPDIYIQCDIFSWTSSQGKHYSWNSTHRVATRDNVERLHEEIKKKIPDLERAAEEHCECEANHAGHKGSCSYHNRLTIYRQLLKEGEEILAIPLENPIMFRARADIYMGRETLLS